MIAHQKNRTTAARFLFFVGLLILAIKFYAYFLTSSTAVFSDALESVVNVIAGAFSIWVIRWSAKPADQNHPYGHGKIEFFSAAFEGGLICFASLFVIAEAVEGLWFGTKIEQLSSGLNWIMLATGINLLTGLYVAWVGQRTQSAALMASAQHLMADVVTSVGVLGGLALVEYTGWLWIDSVVALAIAVALVLSGVAIVRRSINTLLDAEDLQVLRRLREIFVRARPEGIIQIHHVKVIRSGRYHHIDAHVVMPEFWDVRRVHEHISDFENRVLANYEFDGEMNFHIDPCRQAYCEHCSLKACDLRRAEFVKPYPVRLEQLRSFDEPPEFTARLS